jgi:hypothetical protein
VQLSNPEIPEWWKNHVMKHKNANIQLVLDVEEQVG